MPGTTIIDSPPDADLVDDALESVRFTDDYGREDVLDTEETVVAHTGYDAYPTTVVETDGWTMLLEGYVYDRHDTDATLENVAAWLDAGDTDRLARWLDGRDGDFLITAVDQDAGETWVVNDMFGRLPTCRAEIGDTTVLTREIKVIRGLAAAINGAPIDADPLGLGQMLMFGYPLGPRTLFDLVEQLPPGSLLRIGDDDPTSLTEFRFDDYRNDYRSITTNARFLTDLFLEACKRRAEVTDTVVVSLSGGLDSRAVIAGYEKAMSPADGHLVATTSAREDGANAEEVNVARAVAHALDVPWSPYFADRTEYHQNALLDMTQGMNSIGMSLGLDFAEQVADDHPDATLVTGDGGDKAFPDLTPPRGIDSTDDLIETIVRTHQHFTAEEVSALIDLEPSRLLTSIFERVESYPESTLEGAYTHFLVRERAINMLNHGEDRTRHYLWSTTPFYSPEFFAEAMACPPEQKAGTKLYREFLSMLSTAATEIDYVDFGAPITSPEYTLKEAVYSWLEAHPALKRRVVSLLGNAQRSDATIHSQQLLADTVEDTNGTGRHFSEEEIQRITWAGGDYSSVQRYRLTTLVAALGPVEASGRLSIRSRPAMRARL